MKWLKFIVTSILLLICLTLTKETQYVIAAQISSITTSSQSSKTSEEAKLTQFSSGNTNNKIKISMDNTDITVGNNFRLKLNITELIGNKTIPIKIYLSQHNTVQLMKNFVIDHPEMKVIYHHGQGINQDYLEILNPTKVTGSVEVLLKATSAKTINLSTDSTKLTLKIQENKTPAVLANNPAEIEDGITNWQKIDQAVESSIAIDGNFNLAFTFGHAGGGDTITHTGNPRPWDYANKIFDGGDVYLTNKVGNKKIYISLFSGRNNAEDATHYGIVTNKQQVVKPGYANSIFYQTYAGNSTNADVNPTLFVGTDSNGRTVLKRMAQDPTSGYLYENLFRFKENEVTVQQEFYFKNINNKPINYGAYYSMQFQIWDSGSTGGRNNTFPMYALRNNEGIYGDAEGYRMLNFFKVPDGPVDYAPLDYYTASTIFTWLTPHDITGDGWMKKNLNEGDSVGVIGWHTAIALRWNWHQLNPGETDHYRNDIEFIPKSYVIPSANKTYENKTSKDGKNRVGDTISFKLDARNEGVESSWEQIKVADSIPSGLDIDLNTIKLIDASGQVTSVPVTAYNPTNGVLTVASPNLTEGQKSEVTFDAVINGGASGKTLVNRESVTGVDGKYSDNTNTNAISSVTIPVEKADYLGTLTKQVKNITVGETTYKKDTDGHIGDKVAYELTYNVDATSTASMVNGILNDVVPTDLDVDSNSIKVTNPDGTVTAPKGLSNVILQPSTAGKAQKTVVDFEATIKKTAIAGATIINTGKVVAKTNTGNTLNSSSEADINVKEVPYKATLLKQVKNETTNKLGTYADMVDGHIGDTIDYRMIYSVDSTSPQGLKSGDIQDILPKEVDFVKGSVKVSGDNQTGNTSTDLNNLTIKPLGKGQKAQVDFKVKINDQAKPLVDTTTPIKNIGHLINGKTDAGTDTSADSNEADINVKKIENGTVTFKYVDRQTDQEIGDKEVVVKGPIGKKISDLTTAETGGKEPNKIRPEFIKGYVGIDYTDQTDLSTATFYQLKNVDPVIAATPQMITIRYERSGIKFAAPKVFDFGEYLAHDSDITYYLQAQKSIQGHKEPYAVSIADYYGVQSWQLSVDQAQQFTGQITDNNGQSKKVQLDNATLQFDNAQMKEIFSDKQDTDGATISNLVSKFTLIPGIKQPALLVDYQKAAGDQYAADPDGKGQYDNKDAQKQYVNPGFSVWQYQFGDQTSADYSIGLHVPATTKRQKTHYITTLTWHLTVAP